MSKVIGIDYGKKRIGIAISDIDQKIATATVSTNNSMRIRKAIEILKKIH